MTSPARIPSLAVLFSLLAPAPALTQLTVEEQAALPPPSLDFATAVDVFGDVAVVGAETETSGGMTSAGAAYVYTFDGLDWVMTQRLEAPTPLASSDFGAAVALQGDMLAVGQPASSVAGGSVHAFHFDGSTWNHVQELQGQNPGFDSFGVVLDVEGDRLAVGATRDDASGSSDGATYIYRRNGNLWVEEAVLSELAPLGPVGYGSSVDLDGTDRVAVGAPSWGGVGVAFVYERTGTTWTRTAQLDGPAVTFLAFGSHVQLQDSTLMVSAPSADTVMGADSGLVYVYTHDGTGWQETQQIIPPEPTKRFGAELLLEGNLLFVYEIDSSKEVHALGLQGGLWTVFDGFTGSTSFSSNNAFGWKLAWSSDRLFVAAPTVGVPGATPGVYVFGLEVTPPSSYCTAGTSFSGCTATISATGQASASATNGFDLVATGVEGSKRGLFYWSPNGRQAAPWGNSTSFQCVMPPVFRGDLLQENGTTGLCDGLYAYDLNARWTAKPWQNPGVGAVVQAQFWYRDPFAPTLLSTSISDAIEFTVAP